MTTIQYVYLFFLTIPVFLLLDFLWLGVAARGFYQREIGSLFGTMQWGAVAAFYAMFTIGLLVFVVAPAIEKQSLASALIFGALFGCVAYATYDLTNLATLRGWSLAVSVVDILWGTMLCATVAAVSYTIAKTLFL